MCSSWGCVWVCGQAALHALLCVTTPDSLRCQLEWELLTYTTTRQPTASDTHAHYSVCVCVCVCVPSVSVLVREWKIISPTDMLLDSWYELCLLVFLVRKSMCVLLLRYCESEHFILSCWAQLKICILSPFPSSHLLSVPVLHGSRNLALQLLPYILIKPNIHQLMSWSRTESWSFFPECS